MEMSRLQSDSVSIVIMFHVAIREAIQAFFSRARMLSFRDLP